MTDEGSDSASDVGSASNNGGTVSPPSFLLQLPSEILGEVARHLGDSSAARFVIATQDQAQAKQTRNRAQHLFNSEFPAAKEKSYAGWERGEIILDAA